MASSRSRYLCFIVQFSTSTSLLGGRPPGSRPLPLGGAYLDDTQDMSMSGQVRGQRSTCVRILGRPSRYSVYSV